MTRIQDIPLPEEKPVVLLIAFNRPDLLGPTLNALAKQTVAPEKIICFLDGPRHDTDRLKVDECEALLRAYTTTPIEIRRRDKNLGCKHNVLNALEQITQQYPRFVYVEDDVICAPYHYETMSKLLEQYKNQPQLFCINGFFNAYFYKKSFYEQIKGSFFVSNLFLPYGFASWSDRWEANLFQKWHLNGYTPYQSCFHIPKYPHIQGTIILQQYNAFKNPGEWSPNVIFTLLYHNKRVLNPVFSMTYNTGFGHIEAINNRHCDPSHNAFYQEEACDLTCPDDLSLHPYLSTPVSVLRQIKINLKLLKAIVKHVLKKCPSLGVFI